MYDFDITLDNTKVEEVSISIIELLGAEQSRSLQDWYDDYKITKITLVGVGVTSNNIPSGTVENVVSTPDIQTTAPTSYSEVLRMKGAKVQPINFAQGTIHLGTCRPQFDVTGGKNQFRSAFLSTSTTDDSWYGFRVSTTSSDGVTLNCVIRATVLFRGSQ